MEPFVVFLVIIGLVIIFISFFIAEKFTGSDGSLNDISILNPDNLTDEGKNFLMKNLNQKLSENADEIVIKADDQMSMISNEKIMAVSEYSDQILDKINQNHQEVVFMYNMLNEKEKELKNLLKEMNEAQIKANSVISEKNQAQMKADSVINEKNQAITIEKDIDSEKIGTVDDKHKISNKGNSSKSGNRRKKKNEKMPKVMNNSVSELDVNIAVNSDENIELDYEMNHNERILKMYNEGMAIVEIAKKLDLGQGEVKLVVDLFQGKKA